VLLNMYRDKSAREQDIGLLGLSSAACQSGVGITICQGDGTAPLLSVRLREDNTAQYEDVLYSTVQVCAWARRIVLDVPSPPRVRLILLCHRERVVSWHVNKAPGRTAADMLQSKTDAMSRAI
jgi:hypothetical protein